MKQLIRAATFMERCRSLICTAATPRILIPSARVAVVVGLLLNGINQGSDLWNGKALHVGHFLMNFLVPFCVSTYSAARNELNRQK